jgi:hypothetical protein
LAAAVEAGRVSAYGAAVALGWRKRQNTLGIGSKSQARQRAFALQQLIPEAKVDKTIEDELSARDAALAQELWLGPAAGGSFFSTREELHDAWIRLRDVVMAEWAKDGRRPMAWWQHDARELGLKYPGDEREQSYLFEHGALREDERTMLMHDWKLKFDATYAAGLSAAERRERFREIDLPELLRRQWAAEYRRRRPKRASKKPAGEAAQAPASSAT